MTAALPGGRHAMLDLETLGTGPKPPILSAGLVVFAQQEDYTLRVDSAEYWSIPLQSCLDAGLEVDGDTWEWWQRQSPEARLALTRNRAPSLQVVLTAIQSTLSAYECATLWARGCDWYWLAAALRACRYPALDYWKVRDLRTLSPDKPVGVVHDALADAMAQVVELSRVCVAERRVVR